jgi:hypothetical protein
MTVLMTRDTPTDEANWREEAREIVRKLRHDQQTTDCVVILRVRQSSQPPLTG